MAEAFPYEAKADACCAASVRSTQTVYWLQGITLAWMLLEAGVSLFAAAKARSAVLLAFGADSLVELLSAVIVLLALVPSLPLSKERAARWTGLLLFALAGVIAVIAVLSLIFGIQPEESRLGISITIAALIVMPALAWLKRKQARETNNPALAADSVQSATCAYLAAITLVGLAIHAIFHIHWVDPVAALAVLPILLIEGRRALRGESCGCC